MTGVPDVWILKPVALARLVQAGSGRVGSEFFSHWEVDEIVTFDPGAATDHVRCQFAGAHPSFDGLVRRPNSSGDVIEIERVIDGRGREPQIIVEINLCLTMIYH